MKNLHRIVFLIIALISVGLMGWAIAVGMAAPDSDKIADVMGMTYQYDENGNEKQDTLGNPIPVVTVEQGIESMGTATINQMRKSDATIYGTTIEKIKNLESKIAECKEKLADKDNKALKEAEDKRTQLMLKGRRATAAEKNELANLNKTIEDLKKLPETLKELEAKVTWDINASDDEKVIAFAKAELAAVQEQVKKATEAIDAKKAVFDPAKKLVEDMCQAANTKIAVVEGREDYAATLDELLASKALNAIQKRQLGGIKATIADYQKLANERRTVLDNETAYEANIPMLENAIAQAQIDQKSIMELGKVISYNIYWLYFLMLFAILFVCIGFLLNFFQNTGGIVKTIAAVVVVAAVGGAAYFIATNHGWLDGVVLYVTNGVGQPMLDAAGEPIPFGIGNDPETRSVFGASEYMIADVSIWITYLAFAGAAIAALYSSVRGIFK